MRTSFIAVSMYTRKILHRTNNRVGMSKFISTGAAQTPLWMYKLYTTTNPNLSSRTVIRNFSLIQGGV